MTAFQWLFGGLMALLVLLEVVLQATGKARRSISGLRAGVWLLAVFLIVVPSATNRVAAWLSIGRGADVILYLTVLSFLLSFFYLLHAVERQREQITLLVRRIAVQQPYSRPPEFNPPGGGSMSPAAGASSDELSRSCRQV